MRALHSLFCSNASSVYLPCLSTAARDFSLPIFVLGPLDLPPCIRQVFLPRIAHLRHRFSDRLLFPVHWLTMIHGVHSNFFSYYPPSQVEKKDSGLRSLDPRYAHERA